MNDFWNWVCMVWDEIRAFFVWYFEETPLFDDTLDSFYDMAINAWQQIKPLIDEYILYLGEYFKG